MVMETEKFYHLSSARWRLRRVSSEIPVDGLSARGADAINSYPGVGED